MILVDAHADLAWNMLTFGRDYSRSAKETRAREAATETPILNGNTMLGWDDWVSGRVGLIFATLFAAPIRRQAGPWDIQCYSDFMQAHQLYSKQLDCYHRLVDEHQDKFHLVRTRIDLDHVLSSWDSETPDQPKVGLVILMEGSDGVRSPAELEVWFERGVRILGPAWTGTRYAGGTNEPGPFSPQGLELMEVMAEMGMMLDLSHLAEQAVFQALDGFQGQLLVSHGNPRALLPDSKYPDRHLSDRVIRGIAERQGVMGVVLGNQFLKNGWSASDGRQVVSLENAVEVIHHICQVTGDAQHVGMGSDFDGGFGLESVPSELDTVADLRLIGPGLGARGFDVADIDAVLGGNWLRLLERALPEA